MLVYKSDVSRDVQQSGEAVGRPVGQCNVVCELGSPHMFGKRCNHISGAVRCDATVRTNRDLPDVDGY